MSDKIEMTFKGAQRPGAVTREFDVDVWRLWGTCDAAQRADILADWFNRFVSVATKDMALPAKDADGVKIEYMDEEREAAETARLDAIAAMVDAANVGDSKLITATFFAPGKRASGGGASRQFSPAESLVIKTAKDRLIAKLSGDATPSGKRGVTIGDVLAFMAGKEDYKHLVRAKGDGFDWRDARVLEAVLAKDDKALEKAEAMLAFSL